MLDRYDLTHHLWQSLFDLHIQPPLYNLLVAFYLQFSPHAVEFAMVAVNLVLGLVLVSSTYLLLVELDVAPWLAALVGVVVAFAPSVVLYESWEFYTFPTAALTTFACYCGARVLRRPRLRSAIGASAAACAVVLLNSTFQWPWLVLFLAPVAIVLRRQPRAFVLGCLPLVLVGAWYVKDVVVFGTSSTSSMLGMNLAKTTLLTAPAGVVQSLVSDKRVGAIALEAPFQPVSAYEPTFAPRTTAHASVLREVMKRDRVGPNLNNKAEIEISSEYLKADLSYVRARPLDYLGSVTRGIRLWFVTTDEYSWLDPNEAQIAPYVDFVDRYLNVQPLRWNGTGYTPPTPTVGQISFGAVLVDALALLGLPILAWRSRERARRWALAMLWVTIAYAFVLTSLVEYGENNRFRFDLGALPLVGAVVVALELLRAATARHQAKGEVVSAA